MSRNLLLVAFIFIFALGRGAAAEAVNPATIVQTKYGSVSGLETSDGYVFKGIPYAAPPLGPLRFAPSRDPSPWVKSFEAKAYGNICPQFDLITKKVLGNEDCLKLNIWRPKNSANPLPVMVFIHGGGNTLGAGATVLLGSNIYDGTELSKNGVVVVTINYRLGSLGFLAVKDLEAANGQVGNYAILDAMQALKFVKENIAAFGGDPQNVTVFGESAGAINILAMMASPLSAGLYQRAIIESGFLTDLSKGDAEEAGENFARSVGCDSSKNVAECLRSRPAELLVKNYATSGAAPLVAAGATVDGVVLKQSVLQSIESGHYEKVPVIIGNNSEEFRTLAPFVVSMGLIYTEADYLKALTSQFGVTNAEKINERYPSSAFHTPRLALESALTDSFALCPARELARVFVRDTPQTYRYVFSHTSENPLMAVLGSGHGLEVPYVFGTISLLAYTPLEFMLSSHMRKAWTNFATKSDPNQSGQTTWPAAVDDAYLDLNILSHTGQNFHGEACDFWQQLGVDQGNHGQQGHRGILQ